MARLFEFQGKNYLKEGGIAVPAGSVATTPKEAAEAAVKIGKPVVIKAQVWVGGRGKAGAIKPADSPDEAEKVADIILGMKVKGFTARRVLVEEKLNIDKEFYLSVIPDASWKSRTPVIMFSTEGGMAIESVPPEKIFKAKIDYVKGFPIYDAIELATAAGIPNKLLPEVAATMSKAVEIFKKLDCTIFEINPLVLTKGGKLIAADCRMSIDENASFRHPEIKVAIPREFPREPTDLDILGWWIEETDFRGSGFVMNLGEGEVGQGYIGFHAIGGGSAMIGIDALSRTGLKPANFADTSGNPVGSKIYRVAKAILSQPKIEGYLLAGFMIANQEQWHHAHALVKVLREELPKRPGFPCVLLLAGNKEVESLQILREGLKGLPGRIEIYGSEHVEDSDFIGGRMMELVKQYRQDKAKAK
jgi:succinyl-CoA synthetase beta subunit